MTKKKRLEIDNEAEHLEQALRNFRLADLDLQEAIKDYVKVTSTEDCIYSSNEEEPETPIEPMTDESLKAVIVDSVTNKDD